MKYGEFRPQLTVVSKNLVILLFIQEGNNSLKTIRIHGSVIVLKRLEVLDSIDLGSKTPLLMKLIISKRSS